jgi:hypothetical protein
MDEAVRLLEEALHLRMHGERAPGGNETWREWDRKTEAFLRSRHDAPGYHGEGELADFDPRTGRSSWDDWGT